jgi:hypothetical protein
MSDYHKLLAREDAGARQNYDFDPRVAYHMQNTVLREHMEPAVSVGNTKDLENPLSFTGIPEGSHSDSNMMQNAPKMMVVKRYVIVDTAQRDWVKYPNPYSNVTFTFGGQGDTQKPVPVYANNTTYPYFALPPTSNTTFIPLPGTSNTRGFSFIDSNTGIQRDLSAYNAGLPRGNFIAYDTPPNAVNSGDYFGTPNTPSNVISIRLVRAILPQTPFVSYPADPLFTTTASGTKSAISATAFNTFGTYPYLLFYLNEYRGQYYAPTEAGCRAFTVLTQCNRAQMNFTLTNGAQYFDYTPWNGEGIEFQSPLTSLQKIAITVADPHGVPFAINQPDDLAIDNILLATTISGGSRFVSRATLLCVTPAYKTYPKSQLRVGDRISLYSPYLRLIEKGNAIGNNVDKKGFIDSLIDKTFPVLDVQIYSFDPRTNTYIPASSSITPTDSVIDFFNVFFIPNFTRRLDNGSLVDVYPGAVDADNSILNIQSLLGSGNSIPVLNVTQQPIYSFELVHKIPDTTEIGGTVVN